MADATTLPEIWRPIPGYVGIYAVSDLGRVKSLDRFIETSNPARRIHRRERLRRTPLGNHGYPIVSLTDADHRPSTKLVHRLVLEAFVGPCPDGMEACHNDGDRVNPRLENLRWDTPSENSLDIVRHGRSHNVLKTHCPLRHLLLPPNVRADTARGGHRGCLACARAAARISRLHRQGVEVDKAALANFEYMKIMRGDAPYASGRGRRQAS